MDHSQRDLLSQCQRHSLYLRGDDISSEVLLSVALHLDSRAALRRPRARGYTSSRLDTRGT